MRAFLLLSACSAGAALFYDVEILSRAPTPVISINNTKGNGYSPCLFNFNPAFVAPMPGSGMAGPALIMRVSGCPPEFGGSGDHLLTANCTADGVCGDVSPMLFPFEADSEDPRVFIVDGYYVSPALYSRTHLFSYI